MLLHGIDHDVFGFADAKQRVQAQLEALLDFMQHGRPEHIGDLRVVPVRTYDLCDTLINGGNGGGHALDFVISNGQVSARPRRIGADDSDAGRRLRSHGLLAVSYTHLDVYKRQGVQPPAIRPKVEGIRQITGPSH